MSGSTNNNKKHRIVVVGLDSCDPDLIIRWSKEGHIPYITSMLESGVWARLISSRGLFSDSPWPSFNTGVNPAKHAFYNFQQLKRGTTEIIRADARHCRYYPFWWLLRNAGKKVAVFDVPKTYPIEGVDGVQVSAWGEHYPLLKRSSLPLPIADELNNRFGKYRHPDEIIEPKRISQELRLYKTMMSGIENKLGASQFVMDQEDWDLFISVFSESHYGGHQFFHYSDERHWAFDSNRAGLIGEPLPHIYSQIDSAIAELFRRVPDEATFFIVSVHGIETNYSGNHFVPAILEGLGFQIPPSNRDNNLVPISKKHWPHLLKGLVPESIRDLINDKILPQSVQDRLFSRLFSTRIDWKKTKAFFLPSDHFQGFISINLKGREPWGLIKPGAEYDELCDQICYELKRLMNPSTGKPAVRDVVKISKIYQGQYLYDLPDLVIQWSYDGPINQLYHPNLGITSNEGFKLRKSQHAAEGFMVASGKYIKKDVMLTGASTMDLAPTILYLLGQPIPRDMDGKVLLEMLDDDYAKNNQVRYENRPLIVPEEMRL